jgi:hypothetical protein
LSNQFFWGRHFFARFISPRLKPASKWLPDQGCQMAYFQTKKTNLGKFWMVWKWKMLVYFMDIWCILWKFGIFYGHLVYFMDIWDILWSFGIFYEHWVHVFYGNLVYFPVLVRCTKKNLATLFQIVPEMNLRLFFWLKDAPC